MDNTTTIFLSVFFLWLGGFMIGLVIGKSLKK